MAKSKAASRVLTCLIVLSICAVTSVSAQEVHGTVASGLTRQPLAGALVVLLDQRDSAVATALSGATGAYRARAVRPGSYRLRIEHIGFGSTLTAPFELGDGAQLELDVEAAIKPIELSGLDVVGGRRSCEVHPSQGAVAVVWSEARKALQAAALSAGRGVYRMVWTSYVRQIASSGRRILNEERSIMQASTLQPFVSPDLATLAREGFVRSEGSVDVYSAPDATVLLSSEFADTHCFALDRRIDGDEARIGLRFEPVRGRNVPEVAGVMWLTEQNARLRSVEFQFVNVDRDGRDLEDAFGELTFRELPNGTWLIEEWRIRIPIFGAEQVGMSNARNYRVLRYHETGGLVNRVTGTDGTLVSERDPGRAIHGSVVDSAGRGVAGVRVLVEGAPLEATTDSSGVFRVSGVGDGVWRIVASLPSLEALRLSGSADVDVGRSDVRDVRIELPSMSALAQRACMSAGSPVNFYEGRAPLVGRATVVGRVVDANGIPAVSATAILGLVRRSVRDQLGNAHISEAREERSIPVNDKGTFLFCNLPAGVTLEVEARAGRRSSKAQNVTPQTEVEVRFITLDLTEEETSPAASDNGLPSSSALLQVNGSIKDASTGEPISAASVELLSEDGEIEARSISSSTGAFRLIAPSAGSYRVRAWRLAVDTVEYGPVTISASSATNVTLETRARAVTLPELEVRVAARVRFLQDRGFYERQMLGAGLYLTPDDLSRVSVLNLHEFLRGVQGLSHFDGQSFEVSESTQCPRGWRKSGTTCELSGGSLPPTILTRSGISGMSGVPCLPAIYLDGAQLQSSGYVGDVQPLDLSTINISNVLALEVFRSAAEVPAQFGGGSSACGVILVWTDSRVPGLDRR